MTERHWWLGSVLVIVQNDLSRPRQVQPYRRAGTRLAFYGEMAAGLLGEAEDHGKPEATASTRSLGCEEWLHGTFQHLRCHTNAGVQNRKDHVIALSDVRGLLASVQMNVRG